MVALVARYYKSFPRWLMNIPQDHTNSRILYRREHRSLDSLIGCFFNTLSQLSQQLNPFLFVDVGLSFSSQRLPWWIRPLSKGCPRGVLSSLLSTTSGPPRNLSLNCLCSCITELLKPVKQVEEESVPLRGGGWQEVIATSDGDYLFKCDWMISKKQSPSSSLPSISCAEANGDPEEILCESWPDWEMHLVLEDSGNNRKTAVLPHGDGQGHL